MYDFKIEPDPIQIKLIPTRIIKNLDKKKFHPKIKTFGCNMFVN